jgi:hypothetical protein
MGGIISLLFDCRKPFMTFYRDRDSGSIKFSLSVTPFSFAYGDYAGIINLFLIPIETRACPRKNKRKKGRCVANESTRVFVFTWSL